jgi:PAS domain S-box-containing protein
LQHSQAKFGRIKFHKQPVFGEKKYIPELTPVNLSNYHLCMETVFEQVNKLEFMPHGHCYYWEPFILWSHALSDSIIAMAYMAIPLTLIYIFRKRKDFRFIWIMVLFAIFIFGCGITHVFDVITIWNPIYRLDSAARIVTAMASIGTAVVLVKITPNLLAIPTAQQWISVNEELKMQLLELQQKDRTIEAFQEFEALTETLPQLVWTNDDKGQAKFYNQRWYDYTGMAFEPSIVECLKKTLHPNLTLSVIDSLQQALEKSLPFEMEVCLRHKSGTYRWHLARAVPVGKQKQRVTLWVCTLTDIHDQKSHQQELETKNKELTRINTDLDNFIYTASHDLKSPIANIEGISMQLTKRIGSRMDTTEKNLLDLLAVSASKLKNTIGDLTEIAKIQKSADEANETVFFQEMLNDVKQDILPLTEKANSVISTDFEVPSIVFQRKNLRSIMYNLLSNAVKYRATDRVNRIDIRTYRDSNTIVLEVKDNGLGISQNQQEKLFQMFKRFHPHVEGTGIGLYIIKRIVENHGGTITVSSTEEQGTTFTILFKM